MSKKVVDNSEKDSTIRPIQYQIVSYGADYDVEGLVNRLNRGDIYIPSFQRVFVWNISEASRFVESLLLGLPVPGIFLAKDEDTQRLIVIDGQQRLKSLQYFYNGFFNPESGSSTNRVFRLTNVQEPFSGKTYEELSEDNQRTLNDSIIHATIISQVSPENDDTSVYHVFERLNTSGRKLSPQQIRVAVYNGPFIDLLRSLNELPEWRAIFGKPSRTLKDQELILRFLAFYYDRQSYQRPMKDFLNTFSENNRFLSGQKQEELAGIFDQTISFVHQSLGPNAFRPERALNAAVFDSVMTALADLLSAGASVTSSAFHKAYEKLLADPEFQSTYQEGTSDPKNVETRLRLAAEYFAKA